MSVTDIQSKLDNMDEEKESEDSISLSLTPPILEDEKINEHSDESISEHITPHSDSIENDRSYQEIEISNKANVLLSLASDNGTIHNSEEITNVLDSSNNSIISLDFLERITNSDNVDHEVKNIIEELLAQVPYSSCKNNSSSSNSNDVSLNIFAHVDLDDKSLTNRQHDISQNVQNIVPYHFGNAQLDNNIDLEKIIRDNEELLPLKESAILALTDLDSFRELSNTTSSLSKTEYRQLQEDCHNKLLEYNTAIVYKNDLIQQLSESLDQSVTERKDLLNQICTFKEEIAILKKSLDNTTKMMSGHKYLSMGIVEEDVQEMIDDIDRKDNQNPNFDLNKVFSDIEENLNDDKKNLLKDLKIQISLLVKQNGTNSDGTSLQELELLKNEKKAEKEEYEAEIGRLRGLLANIKCGSTEIMEIKEELESQHSKEVEELRTYFEKKCAELEKNYSEEIFSQQSRKMSGSTSSEAELNSDILYAHPPGPAGDIHYDLHANLTKKEIANLQNELQNLLDKINKYNIEAINDTDFAKLKDDIVQTNLSNILKFDLNDLQNKYHAELEILREDNENKFDILNVEHEQKMKDMETRYLEEINELKTQLEELRRMSLNVSSAVQETSSGEFEIYEVIQSYERRLQEQVALAKIDIFSTLGTQIQHLATNEVDDMEWPTEFLQLRDKFSEKYTKEIQELKEEHEREVERLKEEHLKILNGALERARRRSLRDGDSLSKGELEILKERDNLKKQVLSLRNLLGELVKYFTQCEDELNNTLVDELLKQGFDKNVTIEEELNINSSPTDSSKTSENSSNVTRVHLAPNFTDLINIIENSSQGDSSSLDISIDLKNELGTCLEKLKNEANAILALTSNINRSEFPVERPEIALEEKVNSLKRQLIDESRCKESFKQQLDEAVRYVEILEKEKDEFENQLEQVITKEKHLEKDLIDARNKIAELIESGHKEIVSEGYGEDGTSLRETGDSVQALVELQEKARSMLAQSRTSADPMLLSLIEELCHIGEKIKDESRKDREDLLQQIDVADKKYKTTQKFLEEQAVEREMERDEAQKKINALHDQLRERDKDRNNYERASAEVEQLEQQLQEMTKHLTEETHRRKDIETERNEAVEKIKVLRDIIRELEHQTETKVAKIEEYELNLQKLQQCLLEYQVPNDSGKIDDSSKDVSDIKELYKHIEHLENEVQQLRAYSELVGSEGALKEIKKQLFEIDCQLDKKTKELETLYSTENTNCSSPSEDISVRDIVRSESDNMDECEVPLQQLARLKEKLVRHSRAEDTAIKRIKDLEMHVRGLKNDLEEANSEKDYMKKQIQEQLVLISDFQIRLDEQRIRAEHIEKQTNSSLEHKIYDMQNEIVSLREKLDAKDKSLSQLQVLLHETQEQVRKLKNDLASTKDDDIIIEMQKELEAVRSDNEKMKAKIAKDKEIVPNLVENIISDKNGDIEKLRHKLDETERLLETYTSLNLDIKELQTLSNLKSNGTTLEHMISSIEVSWPDEMRKADFHDLSEGFSNCNILKHGKSHEHTLLEPEISAIMSPNHMNPTEIYKNSKDISHKKVHFEDSIVGSLKNEVSHLKSELQAKQKLTDEYQERLRLLDSLETKIEKLQLALDETEKILASTTETFEREQKVLKGREENLGVELAEKKLQLHEMEKRIEILEQDSKRKDEMCLNLTREKHELEAALNSARNEHSISLVSKKVEEIDRLQKLIGDKSKEIAAFKSEKNKLLTTCKEIKEKNKDLEANLDHSNNELEKLKKELNNKMVMTEDSSKELSNLREKLKRKQKTLKEQQLKAEKSARDISVLEMENMKLKRFLKERESEVEKAVQESKQCEKELLLVEKELLEIREENKALTQHLTPLQDTIEHKNRVIEQMEKDYQQVHANLLKVESKLKEAGNIYDLMNKLKEEQRKSEQFMEEIHNLKIQLMRYKNETAQSVDEITDKVKKELDYSAQIDTNILSAVSDQSMSSISDSQEVSFYRHALNKEKESRKKCLTDFTNLQTKHALLLDLLERNKESLKETQREDVKLIEKLNGQLNAALEKEKQLHHALQEKHKSCQMLQADLEALKKNTANSTSHTDSTDYKQLPSVEAIELKALKEAYEALNEEKQTLLQVIAELKQTIVEKQNDLKHTRDMLTTELLRCKNLNEKHQNHKHFERELRETLVEKNFEIEKITAAKDSEIASLVKQKNHLTELLKSAPELGPSHSMSHPVPDQVLNQLKELNSALLHNRKLMIQIQKITVEKLDLARELEILKRNEGNNIPFPELVARTDYLFAKTLKYESANKALIWQKRYLSNFLASHQRHNALISIRDGVGGMRRCNEEVIIPPILKFRCAAFAIIAIIRMKFLVRRWHSGVRNAKQLSMRHYKDRVKQSENAINARFQVGQPVSSQVFQNTSKGVVPANLFEVGNTEIDKELAANVSQIHSSWSGQSPPCKDNKSPAYVKIGSSAYSREELTPSRAPHLLDQFTERIGQIQDRLGIILDENSDK